MKISVIIPVLNEEGCIHKLLAHLVSASANATNLEFIIVDGGSEDSTVEEVSAFQKRNPSICVQLINAPKGRARQLVAGADQATGEILYFLHADSFPPQAFDAHIIDAVKNQHPAGCFRMTFDSYHPWLKFISWFTRFNWLASRGGDQSQYITAQLYQDIGGFNAELQLCEDYDLIHKLYKNETFYVIQKTLKTSARRYHEKGVMRLQLIYLFIYWKRYRGAGPEEIKRIYATYAA